MRRENSTTQDPDVEESRAELVRLEGQKQIVQKETMAIAENKQQLEDDFERTKKSQDDAHLLHKTDLEQQLRRILHDIETANQRKMSAERAAEYAVAKQIALEETHSLSEKVCSEFLVTKDSLENEIGRLKKSKLEKAASLAHLEENINELSTRHSELVNEMGNLNEQHIHISKKVGMAENAHSSLFEDCARMKETRDNSFADLSTFKKDIEEKSLELSAVNDRLARAKRELLECTQKSDTESARIKSEMGNLALLQQRVEEKHAQLIEAESHFTVEHLARLGYQKLTK